MIPRETMKLKREGAFLIARIYQISGRIFARKLKEYSLDYITPAQGRILFALWREDDISIFELAERTSLSKSTLTSMLDKLEDSGHIIRVPSGEDRRMIMIRLTEKDRKLRQAYVRISNEMAALAYGGLSEEEIDAFEKTLGRIFENLRADEKKSRGDRS